jgi:hypothetical protein
MKQALVQLKSFLSSIFHLCEYVVLLSEFVGGIYENYAFIIVVAALHHCLLKRARLLFINLLKHFSFGRSNSI